VLPAHAATTYRVGGLSVVCTGDGTKSIQSDCPVLHGVTDAHVAPCAQGLVGVLNPSVVAEPDSVFAVTVEDRQAARADQTDPVGGNQGGTR
jgi:hypothetical protein